jgi:hypothetical protein
MKPPDQSWNTPTENMDLYAGSWIRSHRCGWRLLLATAVEVTIFIDKSTGPCFLARPIKDVELAFQTDGMGPLQYGTDIWFDEYSIDQTSPIESPAPAVAVPLGIVIHHANPVMPVVVPTAEQERHIYLAQLELDSRRRRPTTGIFAETKTKPFPHPGRNFALRKPAPR